MNSKVLTVREATLGVLRSFGVDRVFGNPGSTELAFLGDWPDDIDYVLGLQEGCVVGMADGYAQATGRPAFVNLHSAAGLGHALGNLFTAFRNKTPMVVTAGQQARSLLRMRPYLFAEDAEQFPRPYVKWSSEPARAEDVPAAIAQAFLTAMQHPRGPTFVSVPSDDWARAAVAPPVRHIATEFAPDPAAIVRLGAAIAAASKPAFVVGPEIDRNGCVDAMVAVAEQARAAVWASPMSSRSSFPELHPQFAGFLPAAPGGLARALRGVDLIVVVGAPVFTFHVEGQCELLDDGTPVWQITDDPAEAAAAAVGDTIISTLPKALVALRSALPDIAKREGPAARTRPAAPAAQNPIPPAYALSRLSALMPRDAIVVEEAPSHRPAIQQFLPRPGADSFYTMASGGLGYSLPASIGVALARPGRRIVALIGDGSAMYCIQAIWTAAQRRLPITFVIMNNSGYGAMRAFSQLMQAHRPPGIDLPGLDFVALAKGLGCPGGRITGVADLDRCLTEALASSGPALVDIAVDDATTDLFSHPR
ncbi:benzoylformate decarboxylase [Bradyrhizobium diazoefficiens]|uniref:Putative benzoylformate decarboxylase n=2 Tax=Bradyrhizobium diazoefficiens TaxID=1355477 RepID=A0A837CFY1_9BRAD|nr:MULTISPECIES: benzoylformate decarboxylase [Bradyrhizobium]KGJ68226.1 putative benzoylformate decarboxylase [Bradyrhizobium diazoefficiens SEMIA 5080]MCD9297622.1 benzoylformate decarboxylase [Bradyrhizobium diazoefficiens]MCD9815079.1 benzoylformate decarboxylase [Bradyrhizobium diazoefficiens]MCD9833110.1 benzoylformate decarboxylase [Bradyrhizobium diazoefficiens]MCD9851791.1 benzoylformate decarboxylase [Bradyrhizobium diazoefficiens]